MTAGLPDRPILPIPVSAAAGIAKRYGYDQVIVIARRLGDAPEPHGEHVTTYGANPEHCRVAAHIGNLLKHKVMGWPETTQPGADDGGQPYSKQEVLERLQIWAQTVRSVDQVLEGLSSVVGPTDGPLDQAVGELVVEYTDLVARSLGLDPWPEDADYRNDLEWFEHACDLGRRKQIYVEGELSSSVESIESLAELVVLLRGKTVPRDGVRTESGGPAR